MSNACTKRLMQELMQLRSEPSSEFTASPLESDIHEWHFTIRGAVNTPFQGGKYHGRLIFPQDYPFKPPNIVFLTENGRFQVGKKICLSITGFNLI
jgi:ubiquitin-conjugating enzyme E2 J1